MKETAKVGYVLEQFPKLSETFILEEMLELERQGLELTVFALSDPQERRVHEKVKLLKAEIVRPCSTLVVAQSYCARLASAFVGGQHKMLQLHQIRSLGLKKYLWGLSVSSWLATEAQKRNIVHLHAHFAGDAAWVAMLASKLSGIPYSFTVHAGGIFGWPYLIKEKIKDAKFVISISEFNKKYLAEKYALSKEDIQKINVIHCGVDLSMCQSVPPSPNLPALPAGRQAAEAGLRRAGNVSMRQCPKILTVARLEEKKGHRYLLRALKILKDKKFDFHATIVGGGVLEDSLKEQTRSLGLEDEVTFAGPLTQSEVVKLLEETDVFVLPCVRAKNGNMDGIPVSLMEAMAAGVPVVSTRLSGIPELVDEDISGLLVEPENVMELAEAIEKVLSKTELRERFIMAARKKVEEDFDIKKNAQELKRLLLR